MGRDGGMMGRNGGDGSDEGDGEGWGDDWGGIGRDGEG